MVSVTVDCAKLVFGRNRSFSAMMEGGRGKKEEGKEEEEKRKEGRKKNNSKKLSLALL